MFHWFSDKEDVNKERVVLSFRPDSQTNTGYVGDDADTIKVIQGQETSSRENNEASSAIIPLQVYRADKIYQVNATVLKQASIRKCHFDFPTIRLMQAFGVVLNEVLSPGDKAVTYYHHDIVALLTCGLLLHYHPVIQKCVEVLLDEDCLKVEDYERMKTLVIRFPGQVYFIDAFYLWTLRHFSSIPDKNFKETFRSASSRLAERFSYLISHEPFNPTSKLPDQGFPHLEKHYVERHVLGGNECHFVLVRCADEQILCAAKLVSDNFILSSQYPCQEFRRHTKNYCGVVEPVSILGNSWAVYNHEAGELKACLGNVLYEKNALGTIPNSFQVVLKQSRLVSKKPRWNHALNGWSLDFKGRIGVASKKNFILLNNQEEIVLLFGKNTKHVFSLDFTSPICPLLAFAIGLTSFADKLIVT